MMRETVKERSEALWARILAFVERFDWCFFLLATAALAFCLFFNLGTKDISICDEARHGVNAYEMLQTHDYLVSTYQYNTDYFNLKPPLSYWCIALSYRIFGYNRFAMRLYSALSYLATAVMVALFIRKRCGRLEGIACLGLFLAQERLLFQHMARSGDADALFIFLFTASILCTIRYCEKYRLRDLYGSCFLFALAFLCKSWHAGAIPLVMFACLLGTKAIKSLKVRHWFIMFAIAILPCAAWALARYARDGMTFFSTMLKLDLVDRIATPMVAEAGFSYYMDFALDNLGHRNVGLQSVVLLNVLLLGVMLKRPLGGTRCVARDKSALFIGLAVWFVISALIVSIAQTKLCWYVYPALIPLIMSAAIMLCRLVRSEHITLLSGVLALLFCLNLCNCIRLNFVEAKDEKQEVPRQIFFETCLTRDAPYAGKVCYWADVDDIGYWHQGEMLQAEFSADLVCRNGGYEAFLKQDNCLLLVSKENLPDGIRMDDYTVLSEDENFALLEK